VFAATIDCSARRSDDRFEPPNLLSRVPEACPRRVRCNRCTRIRVRPQYILQLLDSQVSNIGRTQRKIHFATARFVDSCTFK